MLPVYNVKDDDDDVSNLNFQVSVRPFMIIIFIHIFLNNFQPNRGHNSSHWY